jgi:ribosomal protein S18 acetylase RimI-like enzyme
VLKKLLDSLIFIPYDYYYSDLKSRKLLISKLDKTLNYKIIKNGKFCGVASIRSSSFEDLIFGGKHCCVNNLYSLSFEYAKELVNNIIEKCKLDRYTTIFFRIDSRNILMKQVLEKKREIILGDVNICYQLKVNDVEKNNDILKSNDMHINIIQNGESKRYTNMVNWAGEIYKHGRFFVDSRYRNLDLKKRFSIWLNNCLTGVKKGMKVFVLYKNDLELGFIAFSVKKILERKICYIDLVGVNPKNQGLGIGKLMFFLFEDYLFRNKIIDMEVGTEYTNIRSQNFYISLGGKVLFTDLVYHFHF